MKKILLEKEERLMVFLKNHLPHSLVFSKLHPSKEALAKKRKVREVTQ